MQSTTFVFFLHYIFAFYTNLYVLWNVNVEEHYVPLLFNSVLRHCIKMKILQVLKMFSQTFIDFARKIGLKNFI